MMRKPYTLIALSLFSASAFAQPAPSKPEKAEKPEAKPAMPAEPAKAPEAKPADMSGPPKPAPELTELAKQMTGAWKCDGKFTMGGHEMKDANKVTFAPELGGFFIGANMQGAKSKENPAGFQGRMMISYNPGTKMFVRYMFDSWGGIAHDTSKGFEGDAMTWTGKTAMAGMEADSKETITKKGPKEVMISGSAGSGPNAMSWDTTCKK